MATEKSGPTQEHSQPSAPLTKEDLSDLREDLLQAMSTMVSKLIQPIQQSIDDMRKELKETSTLAENASEMALTLQDETLELEEGIAPAIMRAQRLGPLATARNGRPRDILVQFLYPRSRDKVLKLARARGFLLFKEQKILVLLDLSPEVLEKRRKLKIVSAKLNEAKIRFRWTPVSDIQIYKNGLQYQASDPVSGRALLAALSLKLTREEEDNLLTT
ncbi:UNVERIFIED_CONTAM: hypothetical protein K2H54_053758 [Gekko kuhli]